MKERSTSSEEEVPYIEFKDLPDETTPLDSNNLNSLQKQIKQDMNNRYYVPGGGTTGQVLAKASDTDYDYSWESVTPELPDTLVYIGTCTDEELEAAIEASD